MSRRTKSFIVVTILIAAGLLIAACSSSAATTPTPAQVGGVAPTQAPVPTCPAQQPCPNVPTAEPTLNAPFMDLWMKSPHNDAKSEAFTHWNETEDKSVPTSCARCHSTTGYEDYLGADGSAALKVDKAQPIGQTIECVACHNKATEALTSVTFNSTTTGEDGKPVNIVISGLGREARCMVCHQGTATKTQVDAQIDKFKAADKPDDVVAPLKDGDTTTNFGFINIHYYAAAITLYGTEVKGGYEYPGKAYDAKFDHVEGLNTCIGCHDPHTTQVRIEKCAECHTDVKALDDLKKVREPSSAPDYNGNGNVTEGMYDEMVGVRDALFKGIQAYAKDVSKAGILYDPATYPYFLLDKDNNGQADKNDKDAVISYNAWTPRLLRAAYNYQMAVKDPGAFAHGNKYIIQLLYDSLEDLNTKLATKIDMSKMARDDAGHFAGNSEAFRHWDAEGAVPASCSRCHSATGLPQFIKEGANISNHPSNGFMCSTCHNTADFPKIYEVASVTFPSGAKVSFGEGSTNNMCLECHQGRESTVSVNKAVAGLDVDKPSDKLGFRNVHYFAAGATLFGTEVKGMYEYEGKQYAGRFAHVANVDTCTACHDPHKLAPDLNKCQGCHQTNDPTKIRMTKDDFNGNKDTTEGIAMEMKTFQDKLYEAIQNYAKTKAGTGIVYDTAAYPYFFVDKDGDGKADTNDKGAGIGYNAWTPRLLKAGYNLQYSFKDPGAYVHNARYVMQVMYDSIQDLGGSVQGLTRPTNPPAPPAQ